MLLYQVHVLHRSVYKQVHVWGTEQWVVVPVERSKEQLHQSVHNLACQHLHQILTSSWSNQTLGAIGERGGPRLDPGTGCSLAACELWPSHVAPAKPPSGARLSACASPIQYGWDSTSYSTASCVRGCALAHVQHKEADGWWALYVCCRLNLVQVAPPYLTGCRSRNKSNTRPIHRFTLAGCPRPVTMLQLMAIQTHMCRITHRQMAQETAYADARYQVCASGC
ncbi:hypothetical protein CI102_13917 [Trichoderma harzianum]|nr:hypothetical protein CI102_13917 [Trichoderma harzianum]